ncbi:MAG: hypothetical protein WC876_01170 [Candidatus Thermoplasmatota archaeon]
MRVLPPRPLLAAAILLVGALTWSVTARPAPLATLDDAARWEGQTVTLEGWIKDLRTEPDALRFSLVDGQHAVAVRSVAVDEPDLPLHSGDRAQATGRLGRWQGQLRLEVEEPRHLQVVAPTAAATPAWTEVSAHPETWDGRPLLLTGELRGGRLHDGPRSVALGEGPWPTQGRVQARGFLRADADCLCHRFDAREIWPWTP